MTGLTHWRRVHPRTAVVLSAVVPAHYVGVAASVCLHYINMDYLKLYQYYYEGGERME